MNIGLALPKIKSGEKRQTERCVSSDVRRNSGVSASDSVVGDEIPLSMRKTLDPLHQKPEAHMCPCSVPLVTLLLTEMVTKSPALILPSGVILAQFCRMSLQITLSPLLKNSAVEGPH